VATINFRMVRLGRELRDRTQTALAAESGVSQAVLSRIESDLRAGTSGEHEAIANALRLPLSFFEEPDTPAAAPLFRKRAIRSVRQNRVIQARVNTAVLAARRILDAGIDIELPFDFPDKGEIPRDDPTAAAAEIRRAWRLPSGRIDNVTALVEAAGGIVLPVDFGSDHASAAFITTVGDARLWFLMNTRETAGDRVRLSLAHELGHAVLHRYLPVQDETRLEPEAYEFAVALTLPAAEFDRLVPATLTLSQARALKRTFRISVQAIVRAAYTRGRISRDRYASLYKQLSARGWRTREPDPMPIEEPSIWPQAIAIHRSLHGYVDRELAAVARLGEPDLNELFPHDFAPRLRVVGGQHASLPHDAPTDQSTVRGA
jgi:Zn-dependent peptidase ImmA (M78 family)